MGVRPIVLVAAVALIDADGRVLLAERPPGKHLAGLWEFPGGKVQPGETPEAALIRELSTRSSASMSWRAASRRSPSPPTPITNSIC